MRQILSILGAGILGGVIVLTGQRMLQSGNQSAQVNTNPYALKVANQTIPSAANGTAFDFSVPAEKALRSVVHIKAVEKLTQNKSKKQNADPFSDLFGGNGELFRNPFGNPGPKEGSGSGVIISADGYIVTNNHVVDFADELSVTLYDNKKFTAKVIGTDPNTDLAVIKIDAQDLPVLEYADSDQSKIGEWVLAVGNPLELNQTVTAGIISAKGRSLDIIDSKLRIESFIQTDAAVNPGNSGGALVDIQGRLLGINTAIASRTGFYQGYSFAIPVKLMKKVADDLIKFGKSQRAILGVSIANMDSELAKELGTDVTQGVYIDEVQDGSAAQYAGLLPKDVITKVNEKPVKNVPELQEMVGGSRVGEVLQIDIIRDGKKMRIPVTLRTEKRFD